VWLLSLTVTRGRHWQHQSLGRWQCGRVVGQQAGFSSVSEHQCTGNSCWTGETTFHRSDSQHYSSSPNTVTPPPTPAFSLLVLIDCVLMPLLVHGPCSSFITLLFWFSMPDKFVVKHLFSQTWFEGRQQWLVTEADTMWIFVLHIWCHWKVINLMLVTCKILTYIVLPEVQTFHFAKSFLPTHFTYCNVLATFNFSLIGLLGKILSVYYVHVLCCFCSGHWLQYLIKIYRSLVRFQVRDGWAVVW